MHIKGTAIRSTLKALDAVAGCEAAVQVRAALSVDVRNELAAGVIATKTHPVTTSAALHIAIRDVVGHGDCGINHRVGIEAARIDFGGIYSIFLRISEYEATLQRLAKAWRQYNSQGEVTWTTLGRGSASCRVEGTVGFNEPMWSAIAGRVAGILLLAGAATVDTRLTAWSAEGCELAVAWSR